MVATIRAERPVRFIPAFRTVDFNLLNTRAHSGLNKTPMTVTREDKIRAMLVEDPGDITLRYMLAMELQKREDKTESLEVFNGLMSAEPPHVPSFLMAGQLLAGLGRIQEAQDTYRSGIQQAKLQGDDHAAGEMTQFLQEL